MPGLNHKGPNGEGPMTGRKMGSCNPDNIQQNNKTLDENNDVNEQIANHRSGRGLGFRCGRGIGRGTGKGQGRGNGNKLNS